jgi:hypothetical protein
VSQDGTSLPQLDDTSTGSGDDSNYKVGIVFYGIKGACGTASVGIKQADPGTNGTVVVATELEDGTIYCQQG